jgi:hypothetical protein
VPGLVSTAVIRNDDEHGSTRPILIDDVANFALFDPDRLIPNQGDTR